MKLKKLLNSRPKAPQNLAVTNSGGVADIYLYDIIDADWGMSALSFVQLVSEAKAGGASSIVLHINSPGGDVFEATAMGAALKASNLPVTARIEGLCASAATTLSMQCGRVEMADGAMYMIHNASSIAWGDKREMSKVGELLAKIDTQIADGYAQKTGMELSAIAELMDAETWFTAAEAKDQGFVDAVIQAPTPSNQWDLSAFANAPKQPINNQAADDDAEQMARQRQVNENRLRLLVCRNA